MKWSYLNCLLNWIKGRSYFLFYKQHIKNQHGWCADWSHLQLPSLHLHCTQVDSDSLGPYLSCLALCLKNVYYLFLPFATQQNDVTLWNWIFKKRKINYLYCVAGVLQRLTSNLRWCLHWVCLFCVLLCTKCVWLYKDKILIFFNPVSWWCNLLESSNQNRVTKPREWRVVSGSRVKMLFVISIFNLNFSARANLNTTQNYL